MTEALRGALDLAAAAASLAGAVFFFASAVGLVRLPDFYTRVHAPTKAATLGVMLLAVGSLLRSLPQGVWLEELLIIAFLFLTVPVSAQVMARAAARRRLPQDPATTGRPPEDDEEEQEGDPA